MGFTEKSDFQGGSQKKQYVGGNCLKRETWIVCRFRQGELGKKEGVDVLKGHWYPNAHFEAYLN